MQLQTELREPVAQVSQEPLGVVSMLKARHVVIGEPHENDVSSRVAPAPLVKHVMKKDVTLVPHFSGPISPPI